MLESEALMASNKEPGDRQELPEMPGNAFQRNLSFVRLRQAKLGKKVESNPQAKPQEEPASVERDRKTAVEEFRRREREERDV